MNKHYIIAVVIVLLVIGGLLAGWFLHYKDKFAEYRENEELRDLLNQQAGKLEQTFQKFKPQSVVEMLESKVDPWDAALVERVRLFPPEEFDGDLLVPETTTPQFFYVDKRNQLFDDLYKYARDQNVGMEVYLTFATPEPSEVSPLEATQANVEAWLAQVKFGCDVTRRLIDAKPRRVLEVAMWPPRADERGFVTQRSVGFRFEMTLSNLTAFLDKLEQRSEYVNVNAVSIGNNQLLHPGDPPVQVDMVVTFATANDAILAVEVPDTASPKKADQVLKDLGSKRSQRATSGGAYRRPWYKKWLPF